MRATLTDRNSVEVYHLLNETVDELDFRDRVIKMCLGGALIISPCVHDFKCKHFVDHGLHCKCHHDEGKQPTALMRVHVCCLLMKPPDEAQRRRVSRSCIWTVRDTDETLRFCCAINLSERSIFLRSEAARS